MNNINNTNTTELEVLAVIPLESKIYLIVKPATEVDGLGKVFELVKDSNEDALSAVYDECTINAVFSEYRKINQAL